MLADVKPLAEVVKFFQRWKDCSLVAACLTAHDEQRRQDLRLSLERSSRSNCCRVRTGVYRQYAYLYVYIYIYISMYVGVCIHVPPPHRVLEAGSPSIKERSRK